MSKRREGNLIKIKYLAKPDVWLVKGPLVVVNGSDR